MNGFKMTMPAAQALSGKLTYLENRHNFLIQNLAHVETPGYIGKDLQFDGFLEESQANSEDAVVFHPRTNLVDTTDPLKANGNNVQLESEMARLAQNSTEYMASVEVIKKNLALMKFSVESV